LEIESPAITPVLALRGRHRRADEAWFAKLIGWASTSLSETPPPSARTRLDRIARSPHASHPPRSKRTSAALPRHTALPTRPASCAGLRILPPPRRAPPIFPSSGSARAAKLRCAASAAVAPAEAAPSEAPTAPMPRPTISQSRQSCVRVPLS
jgi:hypothetical protein